MPANSRWDLIRRLRVKQYSSSTVLTNYMELRPSGEADRFVASK